jgi:hypothetical protein
MSSMIERNKTINSFICDLYNKYLTIVIYDFIDSGLYIKLVINYIYSSTALALALALVLLG